MVIILCFYHSNRLSVIDDSREATKDRRVRFDGPSEFVPYTNSAVVVFLPSFSSHVMKMQYTADSASAVSPQVNAVQVRRLNQLPTPASDDLLVWSGGSSGTWTTGSFGWTSSDAYTMIPEDLEWLGVKITDTYIQSDRFEIYYDITKKLIEMGKAYVCTCDAEDWRKKKEAKQACPCRDLPVEEQLERYDRFMSGGYGDGEAIVVVKAARRFS